MTLELQTSKKTQKSKVRVDRLGANLGAEILGIGQVMTQNQFLKFGRHFGELTVHPFATSLPKNPELIVLDNDGNNPPLSTDQWHSDEMFRKEPPSATIIRATIVPKIGGDTLLASMTAAYEGLNPTLQKFYSDLEAVNDFKVFRSLYSDSLEGLKKLVEMEEMFPNMTHPVVRVHPVNKKKLIYVSPQTTKFIKGVRDFESERILDMLYQLPETPEYQLRVNWEPNMIIIWDNRQTQHYAPRDYLPFRRRMERLTVKGDKPFGVKRKNRSVAVQMNIRGTDKAANTGHHRSSLARPATKMTKVT